MKVVLNIQMRILFSERSTEIWPQKLTLKFEIFQFMRALTQKVLQGIKKSFECANQCMKIYRILPDTHFFCFFFLFPSCIKGKDDLKVKKFVEKLAPVIFCMVILRHVLASHSHLIIFIFCLSGACQDEKFQFYYLWAEKCC